jgi:hypothetical protein
VVQTLEYAPPVALAAVGAQLQQLGASLVANATLGVAAQSAIVGSTLRIQAPSSQSFVLMDSAAFSQLTAVNIQGATDSVVVIQLLDTAVSVPNLTWVYTGPPVGQALLHFPNAATVSLMGAHQVSMLAPGATLTFSTGSLVGRLAVHALVGVGQVAAPSTNVLQVGGCAYSPPPSASPAPSAVLTGIPTQQSAPSASPLPPPTVQQVPLASPPAASPTAILTSIPTQQSAPSASPLPPPTVQQVPLASPPAASQTATLTSIPTQQSAPSASPLPPPTVQQVPLASPPAASPTATLTSIPSQNPIQAHTSPSPETLDLTASPNQPSQPQQQAPPPPSPSTTGLAVSPTPQLPAQQNNATAPPVGTVATSLPSPGPSTSPNPPTSSLPTATPSATAVSPAESSPQLLPPVVVPQWFSPVVGVPSSGGPPASPSPVEFVGTAATPVVDFPPPLASPAPIIPGAPPASPVTIIPLGAVPKFKTTTVGGLLPADDYSSAPAEASSDAASSHNEESSDFHAEMAAKTSCLSRLPETLGEHWTLNGGVLEVVCRSGLNVLALPEDGALGWHTLRLVGPKGARLVIRFDGDMLKLESVAVQYAGGLLPDNTLVVAPRATLILLGGWQDVNVLAPVAELVVTYGEVRGDFDVAAVSGEGTVAPGPSSSLDVC